MRKMLKTAAIVMLALAIGMLIMTLTRCYLANFAESSDDGLIDFILLPVIAWGSLAAARYILRGLGTPEH